jgi:hypothetical protein
MSKLRNAMRGRVSLEDNAGTVQVSTTAEDGTVASAIVDINQDGFELQQEQDHIDDVQEAAASLESFITSLEEITDAGGMTPEAAVVANHAVDAILAPVGESAEEVMPSLESYGNSSGRRNATRISVESLKSKLVEIWEYIKDLIKKARVRIKDWYLKVWSAAPALKKRAEAIRVKADSVKSAAKDGANAKVDISGVARKIQVDGKLPTDIVAAAADVSKIGEVIYGPTYSKAVNDFATAVISAVEKLDLSEDAKFTTSLAALNAVVPMNVTGFTLTAVANTDKRFGNVGTNLSAMKSGTLPGEKMIVLIKGVSAGSTPPAAAVSAREHIEKVLGKHQYSLVDAGDKAVEKTNQTEMTVMPATSIVKVAEEVGNMATMVEKYQKAWQDQDRLKDSAIKAGDRLAKDGEKAKDLNAANTGIVSATVRLLQTVSSVVDQPAQQFTSYVMNTGAAFLTVCEKSLAQYN